MDFNYQPLIEWQLLWRTKGDYFWPEEKGPFDHKWPEHAIALLTKIANAQLDRRKHVWTELLEHSRARFAPLGEPLDLNFGIHRWLKHDREEAYSDWLAWLLSQMTSGDIVDFFDIPELISEQDRTLLPLKVDRESWVAKGHEGASGRLDVIVEFPGNAALVLELKKGSVDVSDTIKQRGYFQHMQLSGMKCSYFLLVTDRDGKKAAEKVDDFIVMPYQNLCLKLRDWAAVRCNSDRRRNLTLVAMVLAFVGAVEINLLKMSISEVGLPSETLLEYFSIMKQR